MSSIVHTVHMWGDSPRHKRAQGTWQYIYGQGVKPLHLSEYVRDSRSLGDSRQLPYLKEVLRRGMAACKKDLDVVLWTNDDIGLDPGIVEWCMESVVADGALSMRRNESGHMGRDLFAFTKGWLNNHFQSIPDFVLGCPCFDLALAAQIRKFHGIKSTMDNFVLDIWPAETPHRYALHENHPSSWAGEKEHIYKANLHNKKLANDYFRRNGIMVTL
jgi:hypothetical protein